MIDTDIILFVNINYAFLVSTCVRQLCFVSGRCEFEQFVI